MARPNHILSEGPRVSGSTTLVHRQTSAKRHKALGGDRNLIPAIITLAQMISDIALRSKDLYGSNGYGFADAEPDWCAVLPRAWPARTSSYQVTEGKQCRVCDITCTSRRQPAAPRRSRPSSRVSLRPATSLTFARIRASERRTRPRPVQHRPTKATCLGCWCCRRPTRKNAI